MNLNEARTVGILFDAANGEDHVLVKKYVTYLRGLGKKVKAIGYFSNKLVPQMTFSKLEYDFFDKKQLNWYMKPSDPFINNFIEEEHDILIDLNITDHFPLRYIAAISNAKFKVGRLLEQTAGIYDLTIDTGASPDLKSFMRDVDTYLLMINKRDENAA